MPRRDGGISTAEIMKQRHVSAPASSPNSARLPHHHQQQGSMPSQSSPPAAFSKLTQLHLQIKITNTDHKVLKWPKRLPSLCRIIFGIWCIIHQLDDCQQLWIPASTIWPVSQVIFLHEVLPCPPCLPQVPQLKRSLEKQTSIAMLNMKGEDFKVMLHAMKVSHSKISFTQLGNCMSAFKSSASKPIMPTSMFLVCFWKICVNTAAILSCLRAFGYLMNVQVIALLDWKLWNTSTVGLYYWKVWV